MRQEARLGRMVGGAPFREHLLKMERWGGRRSPDLEVEPVPDGAAEVWALYVRLHNAREWGFSGPQPITYQAMQAYQAVLRRRIAPWEAVVVAHVDASYRDELGKIGEEERARP